MKTKLLLTIALLALILQSHAQSQLYVGGDISVLQNYEDYNVAYYDENGKKIDDVLKYMKSEVVGWNAQRVRLFVDPSNDSDPQVCQDLNYVIRLAKRIKEEGFAFMLDFHYSDTWADPAAQWTPKAWLSLSDAELQTKVYDYTKDCLQALVAAGATPDFIQTGNEISYGMLWGKQGTMANRCYSNASAATWNRFIALLQQATKACREVCPQAKIIIHTERSGDANALKLIYDKLNSIDYDVIGLSYYPFWHKGLSVLAESLDMLATNYPDKPVQIVETAYYYQWQPQIGKGIDYDFSSIWPINPTGQAAFARDLIAELKKHQNVNGLYWWFPEENGNGPNNKVLANWVNRGLWDDNNHKALPGLYVLKDFLSGSSSIHSVADNQQSNSHWYTLQGTRLTGQPQQSGIYIHNGRKTIIK
jgi:arabinogalactan endo-1,4-beta-galactosidase